MAPRKLRLVADTVRGKTAVAASGILAVMPRAAVKPIGHAIKSAVSAAQQQTGSKTGDWLIKILTVDEGPAMKRRRMISRGRATPVEHRMSHITVSVEPVKVEVKDK